jgi:DNA-binding PadR family transcriptional regulator
LSRADLTPTSYSVLVLVGRGGAGPHDLVRMMRQGRIYERAAESQYYAEPKRLERLGYLEARKVPGRTHERTHYELTEKGLEALRDWVEGRPEPPRLGSDPILRLLASDLVGEAPARESLLSMREDIADLRRRLEDADEAAGTLPHREKYLRLNHRLAGRVLDAYEAWLDEIERELGARGGEPAAAPEERLP